MGKPGLEIMGKFIFFILTTVLYNGAVTCNPAKVCFEKGVYFGVATASYQVEGAWNVSGKGESIWDVYTHNCPSCIDDHSNGDIAADTYHLFRDDVKLLDKLGIKNYRFSISWARVLPNGRISCVNKDGVRYYTELIDELIAHGIRPVVTIYHWDLPQALLDIGGWTNPDLADYFAEYAKFLYETFGDKVKVWITFNEPLMFCLNYDTEGPLVGTKGVAIYQCAHTVLKAHAKAYHIYAAYFKKKQGGSISITLNMSWNEPATDSPKDIEAAETAMEFSGGWFAHPIFSKKGDYPPIMRKRIDEISRRQNLKVSRLPKFTKKEVKYIRGSCDFISLNHYTTRLVKAACDNGSYPLSYVADMGVELSKDPSWPTSNSSWLAVVPWGFRKNLKWIKDSYDNPAILISENGVSTVPGLCDYSRVRYIDAYLRSMHEAINKDGCNVVGYTYWSFIDNFEWQKGYTERFGLFEVDFKSPKRTRTPRLSAKYFAEILKTRCLPDIKKYISK